MYYTYIFFKKKKNRKVMTIYLQKTWLGSQNLFRLYSSLNILIFFSIKIKNMMEQIKIEFINKYLGNKNNKYKSYTNQVLWPILDRCDSA